MAGKEAMTEALCVLIKHISYHFSAERLAFSVKMAKCVLI